LGGPVLISHVGVAVADFDAAVARYEALLGHPPRVVKDVPDQQVRVAVFSAGGSSEGGGGDIELVWPTSPESPVARFLERRGEGLHHVGVWVDDIDRRLAALKAAGVRLIDEAPKVGAEGNRIAFVHPSSTGGILLELQEKIR
jgi:methylmalonyl-CoA/ethylmalonyl-CoA epimerase